MLVQVLSRQFSVSESNFGARCCELTVAELHQLELQDFSTIFTNVQYFEHCLVSVQIFKHYNKSLSFRDHAPSKKEIDSLFSGAYISKFAHQRISMKSINLEAIQTSKLQEITGHKPDRAKSIEAYISFANLGPFDFRTGVEPIHTACSEALSRLLPIALRDTGQSGVVAKFLLGLYNGPRFPFDLTELRRIDHEIFLDCITVLMRDSIGGREVHLYFENGQMMLEKLAEYWSPIQKQ